MSIIEEVHGQVEESNDVSLHAWPDSSLVAVIRERVVSFLATNVGMKDHAMTPLSTPLVDLEPVVVPPKSSHDKLILAGLHASTKSPVETFGLSGRSLAA